jgi:hypothetical protein
LEETKINDVMAVLVPMPRPIVITDSDESGNSCASAARYDESLPEYLHVLAQGCDRKIRQYFQ